MNGMLLKGNMPTTTWLKQTTILTSVYFGTALFLDLPINISNPFVNGTVTHSTVCHDATTVTCTKELTTALMYGKLLLVLNIQVLHVS